MAEYPDAFSAFLTGKAAFIGLGTWIALDHPGDNVIRAVPLNSVVISVMTVGVVIAISLGAGCLLGANRPLRECLA